MRNRILLAVLTAALWPLGALAQGTEFNGLDLSEDPPKGEEQAPAEEAAPLPLPAPAAEPSTPARPETRLNELEIANEDRVKSVQRKDFLRRHRLELTPTFFLTVNDSFYPKLGPSGRIAFYLADTLGVGLRYSQFNLVPSDNVRLAKRELQSKLPAVHAQHLGALDFIWSPIYGKVALFNSIHTFDIYLVGGLDGIWSQTSADRDDLAGDGIHWGAHIGIGQRFTILDFLAIDLSLIETVYSDRPGGLNKSVLQHMLSANVGLCVYLPFGFDYKEP